MVINSSAAPSFFGGIASGIDSRALIDAILGVEQVPLLRLQERQQRLQSARSFFNDIDAKVDALRSAAEAVDTLAEIGAFSATSSNEDILTASASGSASIGSYTIEVNALAASRTTQSTAENARTNTIGAGSIDITVDGTTTNVAIGAGDDLDAVATAINAADAGVRATVIEESSSSFRILLESSETGLDNTFTLDDTGFTASGSFDFITGGDLVSAADASIDFNNLTITRSSNTITDIVDGLTLDLNSAEPGTDVSVTIAADSSAVKEKIQDLLTAYNDVVDALGTQDALDEDGSPSSQLFADSTIRSIQSVFTSAVQTETTGTGSEFSSLAALGVRSDSSGKLSIDSDYFDDAVADDFDGILSLFSDSSTGVAANFKDAADGISAPGSGLIADRVSSIDTQLRRVADRIHTFETRLGEREQDLISKFGYLEQLVGSLQGQGSALTALLP